MATIYKISSYRTWQNSGTTLLGGGGGTCDLSNYYTITNLQTAGGSVIDFHNIVNTNHNELGNLQGGLVIEDSSGTTSSEAGDDEFYHLDEVTWSRVNSWIFDDSVIEESDGTIHLVNDETAPSPDMFYGTDNAGVKGWNSFPAGGAIGGTGADNQVAVFTDTNAIEGTAGLTYDGADLGVTGTITSTGDMYATDFDLVSDERLKTKIEDLKPERIDTVYKKFELKSETGRTRYGVLAQELQEKYPELVRTGVDGMLSVSYFDLLIREIVYLKEKVRQLEKLIDNE